MSHARLALPADLQKKVDFARNQTIPSRDSVRLVLDCLDLTSLTGLETEESITDMCEKAERYRLASVCILPKFVKQAAEILQGSDVVVATVINFPFGNQRTSSNQGATTNTTARDIWNAVKDGAKQIDIVQPYNERPGVAQDFMRSARRTCPSTVTLKAILESAAFSDVERLSNAAIIAISSGVDCIKTSTGKHPNGGATLEAAAVMLDAISRSRHTVGIKITGGVASLEECLQYMALKKIFSRSTRIDPTNFRIGASRLLDSLVLLDGADPQSPIPA